MLLGLLSSPTRCIHLSLCSGGSFPPPASPLALGRSLSHQDTHSHNEGRREPLGAGLAVQGWPQGRRDGGAEFGCAAATASSSHVWRGLRWVPACPCTPTGPRLLFPPGRDLLAPDTHRRGLRGSDAGGETPHPSSAGEKLAGFWAQPSKPCWESNLSPAPSGSVHD